MANLAQIQSIAQGQFFVKDSLGNLVELKVGDTVSLNDIIVAASSNTDLSKIEILFDTNELIILSQGEQLLDATLLASTFGNEELAFDKQEVDETLNAWNNAQDGDETDMETAAGDVTEQATNAGDERAADGGALRSKFNSRDGASTNVESDLRDTSFGGGNTEEPQEQIPTELLNPVGTTTPTTPTAPTTPTIPVDTRVPASVITLSDPTVDEGNQITILATVTNPPQTDLIITLNNGQTITISAGQTTGSTTFTNPNSEDVYIDNSTETYTIVGTDGGNYKDLVTTDTATVTINDTIQDTTLTLNDVSVNEGTGTAKITATIDNAPTKEPLVLTLSNGATIIFEVGQTTAESTPFNIQGDDVYKDGESYSVKVDSYTGGSEFENLVTTDTATVTISDTIQDTTLTLNDVSVNEGTGTAKITATIDNAPTKEPLVLTLSNGATIIFEVGQTTAESTPFNIQGDDVYKDGESYSVKVDSYTGGSEFENLVTTDTATVTINDTKNEVKVNVTAENSIDGKNITLNVSLTNKDGLDTKVTNTPLEVVLNDGSRIPIPVGETVGSITIPNPIKTGGEFTYSVDLNKTTGGNYEKLEGSSTTITTKDIIPPVISIVGSEAEEVKAGTSTGTKVTGTVKISINKVLDNDLDVIFTHNNKEYKVTIEKGKTSVTETVETNRKDDAYKQDTTTEDIVIIKTSNDDIVIKDENGEPNIKDKITIKDDIDPVAVKITAVQTTDKVIDIKNLQNNAGFEVKAKDPYGNDAKISIHGNPAGFGVQSDKETTSGKLGQTDKVYSGHTSEIGVVKDETTGKYLSESIEVVFKNPIQTLDVAFAWRHNGERAKVDFYNGDTKVGYAIVKGGGSNTDAIVEYYIGDETTPRTTVKAQGGTDKVDLVYTFKPANNVSFTKAVFSADGAGSDYLIHSIKYKEAVGGDNTTVVGSQEVAFKIETSVKPDPIWIAKGNTPTAYVKIVDNTGKVEFEGPVNLDKDGKSIVTVRTDGNVNFTATVTDVKGNFEDVNYDENSVTITGSLLPTASNDSITTNEDTPYTLTKDDFGNIGNTTNTQNVAKIKFDTVPANGTIYVLKTEYTASMNDRAEYTISKSNDKVYIKLEAGDIVDISQIKNGNIVFVPNKNSDANGEFKFKVSSGGISDSSFKGDYKTNIDVKAVADAPTVSIDVINTGKIEFTGLPSFGDYDSKTVIDTNSQVFNTGNGKDYVEVEILNNKTLNTGTGPDVVVIKDFSKVIGSKIDGDNGNQDRIYLSGKEKDYIVKDNNGIEYQFSWFTEKNTNGNNFSNPEFTIYNKSDITKGLKIVNIEEIKFFDINKVYDISINASLKDTDGSETLSVVIKNVPEEAKLYDSKGTEILSTNGEYKVKVPAGAKDISDSLTMKVPQSYNGEIDLQIEATSTEARDNSSSKTTGTEDSISFAGGGDIDLSNLKNIVNLKEINLDNGKENKLSLTLDDVLKLSGDDGKIKITGDKFDSVAFKNENGKAWKQETSITENNKIFDVYSGSIGDQTVQVKVEQPISDGITN